MSRTILDLLQDVTTVWGAITVLVAILSWFVRKYWFKLRFKILDFFSKHAKSEGIVVVVYKRSKKNVPSAVRNFLDKDKDLKCVHENAMIFYSTKDQYNAADLDQIIHDIMEKIEICSVAASQRIIHLFLDTTIVLGACIAAPLYNRYKVHLYHWENGDYEEQGLLKRVKKAS